MRIIPLAHQRLALRYAELVLLVNDHQSELRQFEARREERMSADEESR